MLNQEINLVIGTLETIYSASSVPCTVKTLVFYGLIFTVLGNGFIWFNFYLDFLAQNTSTLGWSVRL